jgi:ATP-dependent DNA helicase DinG
MAGAPIEPDVDSALGPGGLLERAIPGFGFREPQLAVARAVARALSGEGNLLVEAGTGTGKTFAYLVPALLSGRRVVVSTGTRVLQDQIFDKDLKALAAVLPVEGRVAVLKGRTNYLCLHRLDAVRAAGPGAAVPAADLERLSAWAEATEVGDLAEMAELPETHPVWREVTVGAEQCLGGKCPDFDRCFITLAKRRAMAADLIVVNHHLLFADLGVKSGAYGEVIPHYDAVIFDEAHLVEEIATAFFGARVSTFRIRDLASDVRKHALLAGEDAPRLMADAQRVLDRYPAFFARLQAGAAPGEAEGGRRPFRPLALGPAFAEEAEALTDALDVLTAALNARQDKSEEIAHLAARAQALCADLEKVLGDNEEDASGEREAVPTADTEAQIIRWVEARGAGAAIGCSPLAVGPLLNEHLYRKVRTSVFTSATLTTGGDMAYIRDRLGFRPEGAEPEAGEGEDATGDAETLADADTCVVGSPFDYARQALLYLPPGLPSPKAPGYPDAVAAEVRELMKLTGGRALLLFTSYRMMESVYERCAADLPGTVLKQGEMARPRLLEALVAEAPATLFATGSFWQGVDVPGDALSCVVIDRLPFAAPDDPIVAARVRALEKAGRNAFMEFQVPMAALALKQGVGRLIRSVTDRGVVAVLDHRITRMPYGKVFLDSLPPMARTAERRDVEVFFLKARSVAGG